MTTSQRAFDQVKNILGKLDRDIDAARARRLQDRTPAVIPAAPAPASTPTPASNPAATQAPGRSGYGRATPLRRTP